MDIDQEKIAKIPEIILKELNQEASPEEMAILNGWLSLGEENKTLYQKLRQKENIVSIVKEYNEIDGQNAWKKVLKQISHKGKRTVGHFGFKGIKYVAIFLVPILVAAYFFFQAQIQIDPDTIFNEPEKQISQLQEPSLILANGEIIDLHAAPKEPIVEIEGAQISNFEVMQDTTRTFIVSTSKMETEVRTLYKYNDMNETLLIIELATDVEFAISENFISDK